MTQQVTADPLAAPGDVRLRHDLQLLNDKGLLNIPLTAWPVTLLDVEQALTQLDATRISSADLYVVERLKQQLNDELAIGALGFSMRLAAAVEPRSIRTFENTPRDDGDIALRLSWFDRKFTVNLSAAYVSNPFDDDEIRLDG